MGNKRVLILTTVMAPYRIDVFNELGKHCDLTVCFEQKSDITRNSDWYKTKTSNFKSVYLKNWDKPLKTIKYEILKLIDRNKIDVAIAYEYSTPTALLFMIMCKLKGIKYFINSDGGYISDSFIKSKVKTFFVKGASGYLAGSLHAYDYLTHYGADPVKIRRHNFTSLSSSDVLEEEITHNSKEALKDKLGLQRNKKYVISVGRFIKLKGFDILLEAWSRVDPDYELIIIGGGELKREYLSQIKELNLDNVTLKDFMNQDDLFDYYKMSDLFVLPTRYDVWGLVVNEAMANGSPIITSDMCIAGRELIEENENGYIYPVDNEKELAERIQNVLSDKDLRDYMSINNINKIRDFTVDNIAKSHAKALGFM